MDIENKSVREIFTERVQAFLAETQMPGYLLGRRAVGDNKWWADFLRGERVRIDTIEKIERFMLVERARIAEVVIAETKAFPAEMTAFPLMEAEDDEFVDLEGLDLEEAA